MFGKEYHHKAFYRFQNDYFVQIQVDILHIYQTVTDSQKLACRYERHCVDVVFANNGTGTILSYLFPFSIGQIYRKIRHIHWALKTAILVDKNIKIIRYLLTGI